MHRALIATSILISACACTTRSNALDDSHSFLSAAGTPFLLAFKIPVCAATVAIAAPLAGLADLAEPSPNIAQTPIRPALDEGVAANCGPPYALTAW